MKKKRITNSKQLQGKSLSLIIASAFLFTVVLIATQGCKKENDNATTSQTGTNDDADHRALLLAPIITEVNLVSDTQSYSPVYIDTNLVNAWGVAFSSTDAAWVASTERGVSTVYDRQGVTLRPPVDIPSPTTGDGGEPTGIINNTTPDFIIPATGQKSRYIFVGEDGIVSAWRSGNGAIRVADRSAQEAVYKGVAIAKSGGVNYLYATNFKGGTVDVFDASFNYVTGFPFTDPNIPSGYAPFNIKKVGDKLLVTYAKQLPPDNEDDDPGPGRGYVDVYNTDGTLDHRFATQGALNSPWGIAEVQACHTTFLQGNDRILIGNFGDGRINIYEANGTFVGALSANGNPIEIEGLWAIVFPPSGTGNTNQLYFTAGPDDEEHGLFGYLNN